MNETMMTDGGRRYLDTLRTFERLRDAYFRYYDTPFRLADQRMQQERRELLDRDGGTYRRPILEIRPEYAGVGHDLRASATAAGAPAELADFAACGLIPSGRELYLHQEEALAAAQQPGRHMVITAGTGSGKTESFLLPILAELLTESRGWTGRPAQDSRWWEEQGGKFQPQRSGETGHAPAIRALVLYPMNALVDDQLTRLRVALDSDQARDWLDNHRGGHRFYFGRYTGATPVTGTPGNETAVANLRAYLHETGRRSQRARQLSASGGKPETQYFVPRLDGAEMRSRWDMLDAAPDVLITNYSMLNVMLLRDRENSFFDSTRQWLDQSPTHRFSLVVDELHTYRGTAGTEVAYLLRLLRHRLGLTDRPDQLRILAASASLVASRDRRYLQDFFGVDQDSFTFIDGAPPVAAKSSAIPAAAAAELSAAADPAAAAALGRRLGLGAAIRQALSSEATTHRKLAEQVFADAGSEGEKALTAYLAGISDPAVTAHPDDPRLRAHLFFRNIPGVWACTDPQCTAIPGGTYPGRTVGRLQAEPATRCECGARVLELLYCQNCGDVLLGGFCPTGATSRKAFNDILLADVPDLAKLPDQVITARTAENYIVYWPRCPADLVELDAKKWTRSYGPATYEFRRSHLNPHSGELKNQGDNPTGWSFHVTVGKGKSNSHVPLAALEPFPTQCPACGDDREQRYGPNGALPAADPGRRRSPIRGMRTGFEKINQVLATELAGDLSAAERKSILFTDSRQDAAKLSAGIALRHYQDLLRLLLYRQLQNRGNPAADIELARNHVMGSKTPQSREAITRLRERDHAAWDRLHDYWDEGNDTESDDLIRPLTRERPLSELSTLVTGDLLSLGVNPGGPKSSLQQTNSGAPVSWSRLYDWKHSPAQLRSPRAPAQDKLFTDMHKSLDSEVIAALFSGAGRDFESLRLGWLALDDDTKPADLPPGSATGYVRATLRVLADKRRFHDLREPSPTPPGPVKRLWEAIERSGGPTPAELESAFLGRVGAASGGYVLDPAKVVLRAADGQVWVCIMCRRTHLTRGCGLCTKCFRPLPEATPDTGAEPDYYAWKARTDDSRFRLNCAELTGQTDRLDAQSRQTRFQDIFLDGDVENPLPSGLDLLSVTTTMEAGVDIGALSTVILGNMPPTRFNYQQRVGRAGRRNTPVAVALTVCRGRSHDEYYFDHPEAITNEPTPKPYLALDRDEIYRRALNSAVLRQAMTAAAPTLTQAGGDLTTNVHGAYGLTADWPTTRAEIEPWLEQHQHAIAATAAALASWTPRSENDGSADLTNYAADLLATIDGAAAGTGHHELSQLLAERGVLPMFGFPTSARYLHLERPTKPYPWPPAGVIDRDLAMAVSSFAPLSEVVKDGRVYTSTGIAAFRPAGRKVATDPNDALGTRRTIATCNTCSHLEETDAAAGPENQVCPQCGETSPGYSKMPLAEPTGFRAAPGRDFDGSFSYRPRTVSARARAALVNLRQADGTAYLARSGPGRRYVVNDNAGQLFTLKPATDFWGGYISTSAIDADYAYPADARPGSEAVTTAFGAVQETDFLFLGPRNPVQANVGIRLNLVKDAQQPSDAPDAIEGRRAAWYSLAFLLRTVAATTLDIQPQELAAGIYSGRASGLPAQYAYLADTTENGAGFSTHLGSSLELPELLQQSRLFLEDLDRAGHSTTCTASCYRCLRDYANMPYHALLDWRLAGDLLDVLTNHPLTIDSHWENRAITQWARGFSAEVIPGTPVAAAVLTNRASKYLLVVRHSLEAAETGFIAPRLIAGANAAKAVHPDIDATVYLDPFTLDRDPKRALELMQASS